MAKALFVDGVRVVAASGVTEEEALALAREEKARWREAGKRLGEVRVEVDPADPDHLLVTALEWSPIKRLRRITGYIAPVDRWNPGKRAELADRGPHFGLETRREGRAAPGGGPVLRVHGLVRESVVDGPGVRHVLFVQGCPHRCRGCQNPDTWDFSGGEEAGVGEVLAELERHMNPLVRGVTLSGGEPFCQAAALAELASRLRVRWPGLDLWVYTGYTWEELLALPDPAVRRLLALADVVVDGRFVLEEREELPFRGSRNQRLVDVRASLAAEHVVEWRPAGHAAGVPPAVALSR